MTSRLLTPFPIAVTHWGKAARRDYLSARNSSIARTRQNIIVSLIKVGFMVVIARCSTMAVADVNIAMSAAGTDIAIDAGEPVLAS